jgi:glycosyltransferase involved in cell wall biosynthesis
MSIDDFHRCWQPGAAPLAVIMISLNEGHNMSAVLENLSDWAQEVFLVDSYSQDNTVEIALSHGVHVVQRRFRGFGDQWNFALRELPITAPWTMKLDPDERLSDALKEALSTAMAGGMADGFSFDRRLWFMTRPLPVRQTIVRVWRTGQCHFTDVAVNEHPIVRGSVRHVVGEMAHYDSPDLEHWLAKQNRYSSAEAISAFHRAPLSDTPRLFGTAFQRRMWLKRHFHRLPFRYILIFLYHWIWQGAWRAGWVGYAWSHLRVEVMRLRDYKRREIEISGRMPVQTICGPGKADARIRQYD